MKTFNILYKTADGQRVRDMSYATEFDLVERIVSLFTSDFTGAKKVEITLGRDVPEPGERTGFCLDESPVWMGFDTGMNWNGWACPTFPKESAMAIVEYFNSLKSLPVFKPEPKSYYDEEKNQFFIWQIGCGADPSVMEHPKTIDDPECGWEICGQEDDGTFVIGSGWTWSHAGDEPLCGYRENFTPEQEAHLNLQADRIVTLINSDILAGVTSWEVKDFESANGEGGDFAYQDGVLISLDLWPDCPKPGPETIDAYTEYYLAYLGLVIDEVDSRIAWPMTAARGGHEVLVTPLSEDEKIALDFGRTLMKWIGIPKMCQVVKRNEERDDPLVCHSHDFCDANEAMLKVMEAHGYPMKCVEEDGPEEAEVWTERVNRIWDLAKAKGFYVDRLRCHGWYELVTGTSN